MQHDDDGTSTAGRKGVAYDWESVLAAAEAADADLDRELASLTLHYAE